jgi:hypothetical protein
MKFEQYSKEELENILKRVHTLLKTAEPESEASGGSMAYQAGFLIGRIRSTLMVMGDYGSK